MDISLNKSYRFQNIYTEIQTKFPSGKVEKDVVSLDVMDRFGNWYGQCKGEKCKIGLLLQSKTKFPEPGEYEIRLSQHMRQNPLPGIHSFALKIKPYQEK